MRGWGQGEEREGGEMMKEIGIVIMESGGRDWVSRESLR